MPPSRAVHDQAARTASAPGTSATGSPPPSCGRARRLGGRTRSGPQGPPRALRRRPAPGGDPVSDPGRLAEISAQWCPADQPFGTPTPCWGASAQQGVQGRGAGWRPPGGPDLHARPERPHRWTSPRSARRLKEPHLVAHGTVGGPAFHQAHRVRGGARDRHRVTAMEQPARGWHPPRRDGGADNAQPPRRLAIPWAILRLWPR